MSDLETFNYWVLEIQRGAPPMSFSDLSAFNESAVAAFRALSDLTREHAQERGWVPVAERLPEVHKDRGFMVANTNNPAMSVFHTYSHPANWNYVDGRGREFDGPNVTHWMDLPEPPK